MKTRIGILTFHKALNYGAALQAFALVHHLSTIGYQAEIIDFNPGKHAANTALFVKPRGLGTAKKDVLNFLNLNYLKRRKQCFSAFQECHFHLSQERNVTVSNLGEVAAKYDAVICGSDQIWNPRLAEADLGFFLPEESGFKRITYAASLGNGYLSEHKHPDQVRKALLHFDAISVREQTTKERLLRFCQINKSVEIVVDPTLLLSSEQFLSIAGKRQIQDKFIFLYSVKARENTIRAAKALSEKTDRKSTRLNSSHIATSRMPSSA